MERIFEWDDIPSLDDDKEDWGFRLTEPLGNRAIFRIEKEEIPRMYAVSKVLVRIATVERIHTGTLLDISAGGLSVNLPVSLEEDLPVKVGFYLGSVKIISKAFVKHSRMTGEHYSTGIKFVDLYPESAGYINGLYASLITNHIDINLQLQR